MRNIFIVDACIVDANGTFNHLEGYPKTFDSKHYDGNVEKTKQRAEGDLSQVWADFCKIDTRQIQSVSLRDIFGNTIEKKSMGDFAE